MEETDYVVEQLKKMKPQAVILFGSASRGEVGKDSDLDFLVIKETDSPFDERMREARTSVKTNMPLDIIVITPKEAKELPKKYSFFRQILKEGKLLYGRV